MKRTSTGEKQIIVHIVLGMNTRVRCCGTGTTRSWLRGDVRVCGHRILGIMEIVGFGGSFSIEVCIEINLCVRMGLVVLKVPVYDLEMGGNCVYRSFLRLGTVDW